MEKLTPDGAEYSSRISWETRQASHAQSALLLQQTITKIAEAAGFYTQCVVLSGNEITLTLRRFPDSQIRP